MKEKQLFLSTKEFSEKLGITESKVRSWLRQKLIHGKKISREWVIPATEIDKLLPGDFIENAPSIDIPLPKGDLPIEEPQPGHGAVDESRESNQKRQVNEYMNKLKAKGILQNKWETYKRYYIQECKDLENYTPDTEEIKKDFIEALKREAKII